MGLNGATAYGCGQPSMGLCQGGHDNRRGGGAAAEPIPAEINQRIDAGWKAQIKLAETTFRETVRFIQH